MQPFRRAARCPARTDAARCRSSRGGSTRATLLRAAADELDARIVEIDPSLLVNVNRLEDMPLVLPR
jgi:hypothetical protein